MRCYYPLIGQIHTGKSSADRETNQSERVAKELVAACKETKHNGQFFYNSATGKISIVIEFDDLKKL